MQGLCDGQALSQKLCHEGPKPSPQLLADSRSPVCPQSRGNKPAGTAFSLQPPRETRSHSLCVTETGWDTPHPALLPLLSHIRQRSQYCTSSRFILQLKYKKLTGKCYNISLIFTGTTEGLHAIQSSLISFMKTL